MEIDSPVFAQVFVFPLLPSSFLFLTFGSYLQLKEQVKTKSVTLRFDSRENCTLLGAKTIQVFPFPFPSPSFLSFFVLIFHPSEKSAVRLIFGYFREKSPKKVNLIHSFLALFYSLLPPSFSLCSYDLHLQN